MSKNMIIAIVLVTLLIAAGGVFLHMVKESGKREYEQKQEVAAAERDQKAKEIIIKIDAAPIAKIKEVMSKKYTRD